MPPNRLELSCPAEAGGRCRNVRPAGGPGKPPRKRRPPGQSKILVIFQGFSELLGGIRWIRGLPLDLWSPVRISQGLWQADFNRHPVRVRVDP